MAPRSIHNRPRLSKTTTHQRLLSSASSAATRLSTWNPPQSHAMGAIESQAPQSPENVYHRHPADVALPSQDSDNVDPEDQQPAERRHRRKHRRRKHRQPQAAQWVRRREEHGAHGPMLFIRGSPARGKMIACIISGSFLLTVLSVCKFN
jgi:hypothetical protein